ncbi:MAG: AmmeMemoRadiSam system radical SAM enzyme [Candidatus Hydrogenedentes bacterium]|nr:AmmeMemoRadiSam system radical SAM enzyme [Candidatus Hydrogenedentota bacterium]
MVNLIQCELCPRYCILAPGQKGECRIRVNVDGKLTALTYGHPCSIHIDPMEKKPLYHFLPGTPILSLATVGCNLHCKNCQNWEISQAEPTDIETEYISPQDIVNLAIKYKCPSIAYTYTEPLAYYEYTYDCCKYAFEVGVKNVLVTAGFINEEPYKLLIPLIHATNIDLKGFSEKFYQEVCDGSLKPILRTLELTKQAGKELEVTNLVIPTLNDSDEDFRQLSKWIASNLGADTPLHFSQFYPRYKMTNLPPTPLETLIRAREIAISEGLLYVYIGNIRHRESSITYCPKCKSELVERYGFNVIKNLLNKGKCPYCGTLIYGVWE